MNLVWFNQEYYFKKLQKGRRYYFYGKADMKPYAEMANPVFSGNFKDFAVIVPVYGKNSGLTQNIIRKTVRKALDDSKGHVREVFSKRQLKENSLTDIETALENIHFPVSNEIFHKARERLVFQEFLILQLALLFLKKKIRTDSGSTFNINDFTAGDRYAVNLDFELTGAQKKVLSEIRSDLSSGRVMHRLVQGDVGCGKTAVAAAAIADVCSNGLQSAFMAPTEILAMQHYKELSADLAKVGVEAALLRGRMKKSEKDAMLQNIKNGEIDLVIGTHALIQDDVEFKQLGLVVTDEQHRFGVNQRNLLEEKGVVPHSLVLTATPIPRTLALILYGDLDISVVDEMPPGRKKIKTYSIDESKRDRVLEFARSKMENGEQVYLVCPRIGEEGEDDDMSSVNEMLNEMKRVFKGFRVEAMHGKMTSDEKEERMKAFYEGKIDMLVATTVIEVGVDVPNATLMIIENSERFGLAQLHQLRGRVGRGAGQSYCILINRGTSEVAKLRMDIMEQSTDGFLIAEKDLKIRGPGEFFGTRQHGLPELKIANIYTDMDILKRAQKCAVELLKEDPDLIKCDNANIMVEIDETYGEILTM
jgi:ATP-dependent DNA helicase RecG